MSSSYISIWNLSLSNRKPPFAVLIFGKLSGSIAPSFGRMAVSYLRETKKKQTTQTTKTLKPKATSNKKAKEIYIYIYIYTHSGYAPDHSLPDCLCLLFGFVCRFVVVLLVVVAVGLLFLVLLFRLVCAQASKLQCLLCFFATSIL